MERHLAAILAADVVGYSRLMGADEEGTLERLKALRKDLVQPAIARRKGRIVKFMGDGLLAEFPSVVEAVHCALDIQMQMAQSETGPGDEARIRLRIGVNLGDVIRQGNDIYGDGVNIAARLEGLAAPGGVCISGSVHDQVRDRLDADFEDLGAREVKNIERPVRAWHWRPPGSEAPAEHAAPAARAPATRPAVAVLPFANMSNDPEQDYFADGLTGDIITALTYWRSFPVIARNSSFAYKNKSVNIRQVSRELGARYVLEGSVRKMGERVRITAQLTDGEQGTHVWADRYDRGLTDIFEVQDEIVQRIAAHVAPEMSKAELKHGAAKRVEDLDAWDLVIRAMPLVRKPTKDGGAQARELLKRAIDLRPDYSDAYAGLAMSYNKIPNEVAADRKATATLAMEAAQNAVDCDETSSWAHHELSTAYQWLNRFDDALDEARVAVELNPNDAYALHALGNKSNLAGDAAGIAMMEKAQKLNPEDASRHTHLAFLARAHVNAGNYEQAAESARQAIRRAPNYAPAHYILAIALGFLGRIDEAKAELERCEEVSPGFVESRRTWEPYADPESNERFAKGLGLIEA